MTATTVDLAGATRQCRTIAEVFDAAEREGAGVLVVRRPDGRFVGAWVCDDVPRGRIEEISEPAPAADEPLEGHTGTWAA